MSKLFEETEINGLSLENRFIRSATWEGMAGDDGCVTPKLIKTMTDLTKGGVGLIITGHAYVRKEGQAGPWQLGVYSDELIPGLRDLTDAVHEHRGKIVMQISHAGKSAYCQIPLVVSKEVENVPEAAQEIKTADIPNVVNAFANAAKRAQIAGFDGVQIHCAHGYLLSQFLSPTFNQRKDKYGGSIENRTQIHVEIIQAIRETVGKDYPVLIKLNCQDFIENGLILEDSLVAGQIMSVAGIDAIELSGGFIGSKLGPARTKIKNIEDEAYFKNEARRMKERINIPLILVGGMRSFHIADALVEEGTADYISLCRPLIKEPDLINRWKAGDLRPALCKSENLCQKACFSGDGLSCLITNDI